MITLGIMEVGHDIGVNIIASLIFIGFQFLFIWFLIVHNRRKIRSVLRIKPKKRSDVIKMDACYANSGRNDKEEGSYLSYPCEYVAVGKMESFLKNNWKNVDLDSKMGPIKVNDANNINPDRHLLLIGGPFHNLKTGYVFGMIKEYSNVPFYFDSFEGEDATLFYTGRDKNNPTPYKPTKNGEGKYTKDYGVIINIKNPYNTEKRLIAVLGCRTFGVLSAMSFLTEHSKDLLKSLKDLEGGMPDEYGIIVKNGNDGENINETFEVVEAFKMQPILKDALTNKYLKDLVVKDI